MAVDAPVKAQPCRDCDAPVLLVFRIPAAAWDVVDAADVPASTVPGCVVLVGKQVWEPLALIDHFRVTRETTEAAARDLANGYPWHRLHRCRHTEGGAADAGGP